MNNYVNKAATLVADVLMKMPRVDFPPRALQDVLADIRVAAGDGALRAINWIGPRLPLRHRHVLTRDGRLRLRYAMPGVVAVTALLLTGAAALPSAQEEDYSFLSYKVAGIEPAAGLADDIEGRMQSTSRRLGRYLNRDAAPAADSVADSGVTMASLQPRAIPQPKETTLTIGKGDTLAAVLNRAGVTSAESHNAVEVLKKEFDPRRIRPGQDIYVRLDPVSPETHDEYRLTAVDLAVDPFKSVSLTRSGDEFAAKVVEKPVERKVYAKAAPIEVSLYGSAEKAGIPNAVTAEVIRAMSFDIDFQRDIRRGDSIEVMYDQEETADGKGVRFGNVIFAKLNINGTVTPVYRYEMKNGDVDYYTADGKSVRKALMKTPIDGARVSSGYGMRKHPVLGYSKMHKGMDFAAPTGTPIYAAGDGTIEKLGRWSAYGNYIRIRHNGDIKTAYAHLSKYAKGLSAGSRVKQGQVIGYVGATGRVTGAHLHYEILMGGTQVNPNSVKLPTGETLKGAELAAFKSKVQQINRQFEDLMNQGQRLKVASAATFFR
jgi:murein DD-endopeptidase MepM/ murein hydrolase activator NlpD